MPYSTTVFLHMQYVRCMSCAALMRHVARHMPQNSPRPLRSEQVTTDHRGRCTCRDRDSGGWRYGGPQTSARGHRGARTPPHSSMAGRPPNATGSVEARARRLHSPHRFRRHRVLPRRRRVGRGSSPHRSTGGNIDGGRYRGFNRGGRDGIGLFALRPDPEARNRETLHGVAAEE